MQRRHAICHIQIIIIQTMRMDLIIQIDVIIIVVDVIVDAVITVDAIITAAVEDAIDAVVAMVVMVVMVDLIIASYHFSHSSFKVEY